jgi:predicted dehydrogenase/threonine dehydrogenase-like Zn-dependent dehydrogenase
MRQILLNSSGALVARMPRPLVGPGAVLVRVHYSLISVGTEVASLRPAAPAANGTKPTRLVPDYLGRAIRNPKVAARRLASMAKKALVRLLPEQRPESFFPMAELEWTAACARNLRCADGALELETDDSPSAYQVLSRKVPVPEGRTAVITVKGRLDNGPVLIGLLDENHSSWLGLRLYDAGPICDQLIIDPNGSGKVTVVVANAGRGRAVRGSFEALNVAFVAPNPNGLPLSELNDQGWNAGYSAAGEVIAIGQGVSDLQPGDWVACGGAGQANHADYITVKRNLVCRIPRGCSVSAAATATVGIIALQGVRRAAPQLGERVCLIGLGLIGQITMQLLRASGALVYGLDLDPRRVARARKLGMEAGASDNDEFKKLLRDATGGRGADRTVITAATKSDAVINLAMEVTRAKGTVVIVGDVGLNIQRADFYRKEIDLLMSTSYGPGRYDRAYEDEGRDYPFAYVRWTMNRNMQAYLDLIAAGRLDIEGLIDRVVSIDQAPLVYQELAGARDNAPLGVLLKYGEDSRKLPEPADAPRITIGGHQAERPGTLNYALVGVGGFGTGMLVPQMEKRRDRFFLRGVVSRDTTRGGNFARTSRAEVLATDLKTVLDDPKFDLVVIATRHHEHATQALASLQAGKHVFVEKPLALTWEELHQISSTYPVLHPKGLLMVGFNRRFAPALRTLQGNLKERRAPLVISYRVNAGYVPPDSWLHGPEGGGRNLGEACHMYDVFRSLAGAPVAAVSAHAINPGALPYQRSDNFSATLTYEDGTVANLVYTALGPKQGLGKERIEVFADGDTYVIDDFKSLVRASDGKALWESQEVDKGHFEELSRFGDAIVSAGPAPIPFEEIIETTAVSLLVEDLIQGRVADDPE